MTIHPRPRQQATAAVALAAMVISSFTPLISEPTHPDWWENRTVKSGNPAQNKGVANIGQLKHIATQAHAELESLLPGGAGYSLPFAPPPVPADAAWYENQKKALNLGQLKAVAKPLYDRLNAISPEWLISQFQANGLSTLGTHYFQDANTGFYSPWNPTTPVSENYKLAIIGQLKSTFALRFRETSDGDAAPDLMELAVFGDTNQVITSMHDTNSDGYVNYHELINGYGLPGIDSDLDGTTDSNEIGNDRDLNIKDNPAVKLIVRVSCN